MRHDARNTQKGPLGAWAKESARIKCDRDGEQPWRGAMLCSACGWLYRIVKRPDGNWAGPEQCGHCKAELLDNIARPNSEGTARLCCESCFTRCGGAGALAELPN